MMYEVPLSDEQLQRAAERAHKMSATELYNHGGLREKDSPYHGLVGEEAVKELFIDKGKWFHHTSDNVERPDDGDFAIELFNKGKFKLDVKTASQPHYTWHLVPTTQRKYPYYIGVRLDIERNKAEIHGWCLDSEMYFIPKEKSHAKIDNNGMLLSELHDMDSLLDQML